MRELQKHIETNCVQAGYTPGSGQPRQIPIIQSTTFKYDTCEAMGQLFDLEAERLFLLAPAESDLRHGSGEDLRARRRHGGNADVLRSGGKFLRAVQHLPRTATTLSHLPASTAARFNLISVTMAKMGVEVTFVAPDCSEQELEAAFRPNTKAVFGETIANPALTVLDIETLCRTPRTGTACL